MKKLTLFLFLSFLSACPPPATGPHAGKTNIDPEACGVIDGSQLGRKVHAFLVASAELDRTSYSLEVALLDSCRRMAVELQISPLGDAKTLCNRVSKEIEESFNVSVSTEERLVTRTEPPICTTKVDYAADLAAQCEATPLLEINAWCDGHCSGVCGGTCEGGCSVVGPNGQCAGDCDGVCKGGCNGACEGSARVDASAECRASAEIRADVRTECTEPKVAVVKENITVIDASRFDRATRAIDVGMASILSLGAKAGVVSEGITHWFKTAGQLGRSSADFFSALGDQSVCAIGQLGAALGAASQIEARVSVSIEVSASLSASAGASSR